MRYFSDEIIVPRRRRTTPFFTDARRTKSGIHKPICKSFAGFLQTETVKIGGSISGSIEASWKWSDPWSNGFEIANPDTQELKPTLSGLVYFDARPYEEFRVHGSIKTSWPFTDVRIFELFSDFQLGDSAYFRFGKTTVKWGVGYFFSPADIINLESINVFDPTRQREGPLQFRVLIPYGPSQNTLSFYTIFDEKNPDYKTTALAGKAEFVLGSYELGVSGYYRNDTTERAAMTLTGPLGSFDVFAEGVLARGSPKTFYTFNSDGTYSKSLPADHRSTLILQQQPAFFTAISRIATVSQ